MRTEIEAGISVGNEDVHKSEKACTLAPALTCGELSGAKNIRIKITKSLAKGDPYTEYDISWE